MICEIGLGSIEIIDELAWYVYIALLSNGLEFRSVELKQSV